MELDEGQLRSVPDAGILCRLPNGIGVIRMRKHEPIDMTGLSPAEVEVRTNKASGSKFRPGTTLTRIVEITQEILDENGAQPGTPSGSYDKMYDESVGISRGRTVSAVRVRTCSNGTLAHAYPVDERRA